MSIGAPSMRRKVIVAFQQYLGLAAVSFGVGQVFTPAGWIVAGAGLVAFGVAAEVEAR